MKSKIIVAAQAAALGLGIFALQGCYGPSYYGGGGGYGYAGGPGSYAEPAPVVVGDYDEHHAWHNRDWWVSNRRDWVSTHHSEWLAHNGHVDQHEVHASNDHR